MNNIKNISVNETTSRTVLYQFDKGQYLKFEELIEDGTHVLLSNKESKKADRKIVINNKVEIIDDLLLVAGTLTVNVQKVDEHSETTIKTIKVHILPRKEGNNEVTDENKQTFIQQVQQIMTNTKAIAESAETKMEEFEQKAKNGEFDGDDYVLTEEDKKEIAGQVDLSQKANKTEALKSIQIALNSNSVRSEYADGSTSYSEIFGLRGVLQDIEAKADKTYVDTKLNEIKVAQIVDELPEVGIDGVLYLVPKAEPDTNDIYDEYKYVNGAWEHIGIKQITIDLSEYVKKEEMETAIAKATSDEWHLLHQYTLAEDTATILDFDTFDFANKYKAIRICLSNQYSKNAQSIYCYLNEESMTYLMNFSAGSSSSNCRYDFTFINEPFYTQTLSMTIKAKLDRHVTGASQLTSYVNTSNIISKIEDIKGMKIVFQGEGTFPAGARISILGKEA